MLKIKDSVDLKELGVDLMENLCLRPRDRGNFIYLDSVKIPRTYYYHECDNIVDTDKADDGECIIKMNTLLHCFYDGDDTVYFMDSKCNIRMRSTYYTTHEFYMDYYLAKKGKKLKQPTIKKFIKNIKEWYDYD